MALRHLVLAQMTAALDEGWSVVGISARGQWVNELEAIGIEHRALESSTRSFRPAADLRAALQLWRLLRRERPDVLHTHNPKPGVYGRVIGRLAGVPIVVNTVHGLYATERDSKAKRFFVLALEWFAARFSDAELVQNPEDLELFRRRRVTRSDRSSLLGNGIDLTRFNPARFKPGEREAARHRLGISDDQIVIGAVGRLVAEKGYPELFEAMAKLGPRYVLVVAGPEDRSKRDALAAERIAEAERAGVRFLGMRDDIETIYALMDVYVLPSHREGFPRAAMEASAMGIPVVATDIRGCRQVVTDRETGYLVPVGDADALAERLKRLGDERALRVLMGERAAARARAHFDEQEVVRKVLKTYQEVAARKGLTLDASRRRRPRQAPFKRVIDVVGAASGLLLASPILLAAAAAVRLTMGAPILYRQERSGLMGSTFEILKFRTMREAYDSDGNPLPDSERLTRLGKLLRRTSVDELPELVNVLRGDMSLVGPRPLLSGYQSLYSSEQARRHEVRPGITGWAQVSGRNGLSWEDKFAHDVWYVDNRSFLLDLKILLRSVALVLRGEGISNEEHATMAPFTGSGDASGIQDTALAKMSSRRPAELS